MLRVGVRDRGLDHEQIYPIDQTFLQFLAQNVAFAVVATLVLLPLVFHRDGASSVHRLLAHRAVAWLGFISYGLFLWHLPIAAFIAPSATLKQLPLDFLSLLLITSTLTIALAAASFYMVERPAMRFAIRRWS